RGRRDRVPPPRESGLPRERERGALARQPPRRDRHDHARPRARLHARGECDPGAAGDRRGAGADRRGHVRHLPAVRPSDRPRAPRSAPLDDPLHRGQAKGRARLTEPARRIQTALGARTDALAPISVARRSLAASATQWLGLSLIACAAVLADQLTKQLVASRLSLDEEVHILGPFSIHHVQNSGIAFGIFASATAVVIVLTTLAVGWMLVFFARSGARHPVLPAALGLLIGGSISNLVDRVRLGHVTDFLDLRYWPAFNLADSCIVVGVAILLAALVAADRDPRRA